jgi:hypothetical protein
MDYFDYFEELTNSERAVPVPMKPATSPIQEIVG